MVFVAKQDDGGATCPIVSGPEYLIGLRRTNFQSFIEPRGQMAVLSFVLGPVAWLWAKVPSFRVRGGEFGGLCRET